jgi:hypothetical protein
MTLKKYALQAGVALAVIWLIVKLSMGLLLSWPRLTAEFAGLPADYLFLGFPREDCARKVPAGERCPRRAVLVQKAELDSGRVGFSEDGEHVISSSLLTFSLREDQVRYLDKWRAALQAQGYSEGIWQSRGEGSAAVEIALELHEAANDRRERYVYRVRDGAVTSGTLAVMDPFSLMAVITGLAIPISILMWAVQRFHRKKRRSPA